MTSPYPHDARLYRSGRDPKHPQRLLLLTYSFPPDLEVGALRWQKLSRFAAERGWGIDVVTLDPSELPRQDAARMADLPDDLSAVGVPHRTSLLARFHALMVRAKRAAERVSSRRGLPDTTRATAAPPSDPASTNAGAPRSRSGLWRSYLARLEYSRFRQWARDAAAVATAMVEPQHIAVITSGPPHMAHEAGRLVATRTGLPLVVDLRDPWAIDEGHDFDAASETWFRLARRYERRVFRAASLIIANTDGAREAIARNHPEAAARLITVMNGFDDDDPPRATAIRPDRFVIAFAGTIYLDRNPEPLFRALALLVARAQLSPRDIGVEFMGDVQTFAGRSVVDIARSCGVEDFVQLHGPRSRQEARAFLASAAVLVSLPQNSRLSVPAKIFEYMQFDAWVVALSDPQSATAMLLRETSAAAVSPDDVDSLADVLAKYYAAYRRNERPRAIAADPRYSRRAQANLLFDALSKFARRSDRGAVATAAKLSPPPPIAEPE